MKYLIFLLAISVGTAQQNGQRGKRPMVEVSGKVIDAQTKQPLEFATVIFTPVKGKKISGDSTDKDGAFSFSVAKGAYNISIEFISFKSKKINNKEILESTNLGVIELKTDNEQLDEVEIIAEKSTVEIKLDKKIYNVGKDMTIKGGSASDVLDNVPSVSVDVEGNVSLRGNENVRILVDGKPSGLVGLSGTDALRQLPADAIEKVEVITSPSARYDAEGTAGILNIVLRKGKAKGMNGSVTISGGIPHNLGASLNMNLRTNKFNFFTNLGVSDRLFEGRGYSNVNYFTPSNGVSLRNATTTFDRARFNYNGRFGAEYFLSEKASITGTFLYRKSKGENENTTETLEYDELDVQIENAQQRLQLEENTDETKQYSLNYTQKFKDDDHKLTFDFQYGESSEAEPSRVYDGDKPVSIVPNNLEELINTTESSKDYLFKIDYVLPIDSNTQFEFGAKADLQKLDSDYLVEVYDPETGKYVKETNVSNNLDFTQNIYSFYAQYGKKINTFSFLVGLRSETTNREIILSDVPYYKTFIEPFPTLNLGFELSDSQNLTLGYARRLRRPRHWFLNPFESRSNETYIRTGNIKLEPTYTSAFDIGYFIRVGKIMLNTSAYYQYTTNNIEFIQEEEERLIDNTLTTVILRRPINLGTQNRVGFELTANINLFKWWRMTPSFNIYNVRTEGDYEGINFDSEDVRWSARFNSRITLPGKISWETRFMYRGPSEGAQTKTKEMVSLNLSLSKDILKERGTIAFNVRDLLNSRKRSYTTTTDLTSTDGEFQYQGRQYLLNFTYRFNQKKKREQGMRSGNFEEEGMF